MSEKPSTWVVVATVVPMAIGIVLVRADWEALANADENLTELFFGVAAILAATGLVTWGILKVWDRLIARLKARRQ